jgi:heme exporter protein D
MELSIELHIFITLILAAAITLLVSVCVWTLSHSAYLRRVARRKLQERILRGNN